MQSYLRAGLITTAYLYIRRCQWLLMSDCCYHKKYWLKYINKVIVEIAKHSLDSCLVGANLQFVIISLDARTWPFRTGRDSRQTQGCWVKCGIKNIIRGPRSWDCTVIQLFATYWLLYGSRVIYTTFRGCTCFLLWFNWSYTRARSSTGWNNTS